MADILLRVVSLLGIPQQFSGASGLTAQSSLTAAATGIPGGAAALTAQSSLAAAGVPIRLATSALDGSSSLSTGATYVGVASASLSSESTLTASATKIVLGADIIVGSSDLAASATRVTLGVTSMTVQSSLAASGGLIVGAGTAPLTSQSDLGSYAVRVQIGDTVMTGELSLSGSMLPINRFIDPRYEQTYTDNILVGRYGIDTGKTVIVKNGEVTITDYPYQDELEAADFYLLGGHNYQLTDAQAQTLINAGHSELVEIA